MCDITSTVQLFPIPLYAREADTESNENVSGKVWSLAHSRTVSLRQRYSGSAFTTFVTKQVVTAVAFASSW